MILAISDTLSFAFHSVNMVPTIILIIVILYWLSVILGALDLGFLDFDLDPDYEADVELEVDLSPEMDADVGGEPSAFAKLLSFLNMGKVPFMVFLTFFSLPLWFNSMAFNHYMGINSVGIALLWLVPNLVVSALVAKLLTQPFVGMFERMEREEMHDFDMIGKICIAKYPLSDTKPSQAQIKWEGNVILINAKVVNGKNIAKGSSGLVLEFIKQENYYLVEPYDA